MKILSPEFIAALSAGRKGKIAPVWFFSCRARNFESGLFNQLSVWSGDENINVTVPVASGELVSRTYYGRCGLSVGPIPYVADLTDNPVEVSLSQLSPYAQEAFRGHDLRLADCEIHTTVRNKGTLATQPELVWVGVVDSGPVNTPTAGQNGGISLSVRSELMAQLTARNPARSSDAHQRRRNEADTFSKYSGIIGSREITWFKN